MKSTAKFRGPLPVVAARLRCVCCLVAVSTVWAQEQGPIVPLKPTGSVFVRPYEAATVPPIRLGNSPRLRDLIRAGNLYLTVQDAIALTLENSIDLESDRYNALLGQWSLERYQAGGALPGVPSGVSQTTTVASGQGVSGTQSAAGVSNSSGGSSSTSNTVGANISQIGPTTPTLDPVFQETTAFAHISTPQYNLAQVEVPNWIQNKRNYSVNFSQGLASGGNVSLSYSDSYLNENAPTDVLNPSSGTTLQVSLQHNLLQGFGTAINSRNIVVAKNNLEVNDLNFKTEVIAAVVNVLNLYYGLAADYEDLKAKQRALAVAQQLYEDNKKQVQIGTLTPLDVTTAEAQVASSQQDLSTSEATLEQQQVSLKNVLSRDGLADPLIRDAQIIPLDHIVVPEREDVPGFRQLIDTAYAKRADLTAERMNIQNQEISNLGTQNGVLPQVAALASASTQGLSGVQQYVPEPPGEVPVGPGGQLPPGFVPCPPGKGPSGSICQTSDKYFIGGIGDALGQMIRRNYPSQSLGGYAVPVVRNQQAQADYAIDQLSLRQQQLANVRHVNQTAVDVSNQVVALQQARVRYLAAVKNRVLQEQLLTAEQKKFSLGASTTFLVVQQQRDLATAQATEIADLATYSNARVSLDQTLGTTLEANNVSLQDAANGRTARQSTVPTAMPSVPKLPLR
ncbi:MAG: TolC family protein [Bryobacteraceae bacterium]